MVLGPPFNKMSRQVTLRLGQIDHGRRRKPPGSKTCVFMIRQLRTETEILQKLSRLAKRRTISLPLQQQLGGLLQKFVFYFIVCSECCLNFFRGIRSIVSLLDLNLSESKIQVLTPLFTYSQPPWLEINIKKIITTVL
jgi:hypothetical protein